MALLCAAMAGAMFHCPGPADQCSSELLANGEVNVNTSRSILFPFHVLILQTIPIYIYESEFQVDFGFLCFGLVFFFYVCGIARISPKENNIFIKIYDHRNNCRLCSEWTQ